MQATSQLQRDVHWTPACLHLHNIIFFEEAAMQESDTPYKNIVKSGP